MTTPEEMTVRLRRLLYFEGVTRILCRRSGLVEGFKWDGWLPGRKWRPSAWHRIPPLPFHSFKHLGQGHCRVCGQPIFAGGSFRRFKPPAPRLTWHNACLSTYTLWTKPATFAHLLSFRQGGLCATTGQPIGPPAMEWFGSADVDHEVPLFRVARLHADEPWFELIRFWGSGNLRALSRAAHLAKCRDEAVERARNREPTAGQEAML